MVERHPLGSQAFMPLVAAALSRRRLPRPDDGPGTPACFLTKPGQGVNYPPNLWHGVLTPIGAPQDFVVVDRGGDGEQSRGVSFPRALRNPLPAGFQP
jgi:ureidoglycolate lyase